MPMRVESVADAGEVHPTPFVGPIDHTVAIRVDVSSLTTVEVDSRGYIKPGVLLKADGTIVSGASQVIYGAVVEAVKVADDNTAPSLSAAPDIDIAVALFVLLNRDILEDSMGRALSANELAAISAAGSHVALTPT